MEQDLFKNYIVKRNYIFLDNDWNKGGASEECYQFLVVHLSRGMFLNQLWPEMG